MSSLALTAAYAHKSGRRFENVNELLIRSLRKYQERELLHTWDERSYTGRQIESEISRYIDALESQGVRIGMTVGLLSGNCVEVLFVQYALSILGGVFTPFHPMGAAPDFAHILNDAEIDLVIVEPARLDDMEKAIALSSRPTQVLTLGGGGESDLICLAERQTSKQIVRRIIDTEAITRIVYTGGTTGVPKAALASYRALSAMHGVQLQDWEWPDETRQLLVAPLSHAGATCFLPTIVRGGMLFIERGFDPGQVLASIETHNITCILLVPTMINALLDHPDLGNYDISSLQTIFYGASPISPAKLRKAISHFGPVFFQFYGQAEAMTTVTTMRREEHDLASDMRLASCGKPVRDAAIRLVDEHGREVSDGEAGELCVRGPLLMSGYFNKPKETAAAFHDDWLHTGDIAVRDPDGFYRLVDRAKDMVITGGFNVYPRAVENVLETHPAVSSASVFGLPDDHWGEIVAAAVVTNDEQITALDLREFVKARKGSVQTPKMIKIVESIPLTAVGKPDKKELRKMFLKVSSDHRAAV